ncbi:MAG: D-alanyl-D-alanine dipeptidase [Dongiaceae bacterium]
MGLIDISPSVFDLVIALAYATPDNLTGKPFYRADAKPYLHAKAAECLGKAMALARPFGCRPKIFDAYRPVEGQWALWNASPDPEFVADPRLGGPHNRGVALDPTLVDATGEELDMGTGFDALTPLSQHGRTDISLEAQRSRFVLMGLMSAAGFEFHINEWWHYQLFDARGHPLVERKDLPHPVMD